MKTSILADFATPDMPLSFASGAVAWLEKQFLSNQTINFPTVTL